MAQRHPNGKATPHLGRLPRLAAKPFWAALLWLALVSATLRSALASCVEVNQTSEYKAAVSTGATTLDLYVPSQWSEEEADRAADGLHNAAGLSLAPHFLHSGPIEKICVQSRAAPLQARRLLRFCKSRGCNRNPSFKVPPLLFELLIGHVPIPEHLQKTAGLWLDADRPQCVCWPDASD